MTVGAVALVGLLLFAWAATSGALARRNVTGPLVFAVAGYLLANPTWGPVTVDVEASSIHLIAEVTLALLLFTDAARVNLRELKADPALPVRLLGVGLPLSVAAGAAIAAMVFDLPWGLALFLGAALAPTDAALSVQVINDERIPMRLRRSLNVESGLNDGIVTPVVMVALAVAASQLGQTSESVSIEFGAALRELGVGVVVGVVLGAVGALVLNRASLQGWIAPGGRRLAALALASSALAVTLAFDGNGFIAAFVAGIAFGALADREALDVEQTNELPELGGELLALVVWFLFGASLLPIAFEHLDASVAVYALLSLTVVRMLPVALSMLGVGLDRPTTLFLAWFGPRGLASVVFALLAIEELGETDPAANRAVAAVALTVAASILLHGLSAGPGGRGYVQREHADHTAGPRARQPILTRHRHGGGRPVR
ncbi:MAG: cation:proton antiporter [Acidimicrobiales bacterium]|nr:cation:proton antiporter [Acidimicrobiales bacterium]